MGCISSKQAGAAEDTETQATAASGAANGAATHASPKQKSPVPKKAAAAAAPAGTTAAARRDSAVMKGSSTGEHFESSYKLQTQLGSGNYSVVKLGVHKPTGRKVAVKCIKRADLPQEDEEALMMEVKILSELEHPNIVKLESFYKERQYFYVVMEVLNGGELFDRIVVKQYYNEKEARDVLKVLLEAIQYCHDRNIVHRDLKPENLLLVSEDDNADIKVADFGFARAVTNEGLRTQCGTPGYVAPEILKGMAYGKAVDMWSIGVISFILLGGYPPFHDENKALLYKKIKRGHFVFHPQYWTQVSSEAKDLIQKMLTVDVNARITAKEALRHPWIKKDAGELAAHDLGTNLTQLKLFNARRKFKSAISTVILANQLKRFADGVMSPALSPTGVGPTITAAGTATAAAIAPTTSGATTNVTLSNGEHVTVPIEMAAAAQGADVPPPPPMSTA